MCIRDSIYIALLAPSHLPNFLVLEPPLIKAIYRATYMKRVCLAQCILWAGVRLSVTSRYCVETTTWMVLVFGKEVTLGSSYTFYSVRKIGISKNKGTFLWNLVPILNIADFVRLSIFVTKSTARQTDRQTNGQTHRGDSIYCASLASRGKMGHVILTTPIWGSLSSQC